MTSSPKLKRTTLTNGIRPFRYIAAFVGVILVQEVWNAESLTDGAIITFIIAWGLWGLLYVSRRLSFDTNGVYKQYGRKEIFIPYESIVSIKKSGTKINGRRTWKLAHESDKTKSFHFLEGRFQQGNVKEMIAIAKRVNPEIAIWWHPFFNKREEKIAE